MGQNKPMPTAATIQFRNPAYTEALELLSEAHSYISYRQTVEERHLNAEGRMQVSFQVMRLTARLTQIMAWLMLQRALQNNEIASSDAVFEPAITVSSGILELDQDDIDLKVPTGLKRLLERSHGLYIRMQRLENQVRSA